MKIRIYIVTYNNDPVLIRNLKSLYASDLPKYDYEINIINNHSKIGDFSNYPNLNILNNVLRPDFSAGHLSRNWNQGIINGFENLKNPACSRVILMQNDTEVYPDFMKNLNKLHEKYTFVQAGAGDNLMSITPDAVRRVGLFDERFCNMSCQEGDYFVRQIVYNKEYASITDPHHKRMHNPTSHKIAIRTHDANQAQHKSKHVPHVKMTRNLFFLKWGDDVFPGQWKNNDTLQKLPRHPKIHSFMYYPWFEKDVETLGEQKFVI